ncbi:ZIP-like iron-zinc transporter [Suillus placidus]|uniref:ZIP-like iron-zinc transporter n=1 Tax=Suillus placidus TaxID=48579 RepID=A0A9P7CX36_9AGAM|nr:ZIP-like iron-zinc transporter [Suillus placidus]
MSDSNCGSGGGATTYAQLRIASIFIVLIGSISGALCPVLAKRTNWLRVPKAVFDFAKYFGSGVIIATAFIHLLSPALGELSSPCLSPAWQQYPYPLALAMLSIFSIFIVELVAFRWGTAKLAALGVRHDAHGHGLGAHTAHGPEGRMPNDDLNSEKIKEDLESAHDHELPELGALGQIIGVFILEFGVLLHSILIGLTLAVDANFITLFVVIVFHQTFEGLGVGTRLAYLQLPPKYNYVAICGALLYGITTPIGIAAGLGVQNTYNPGSTTASIVSGVLDSLSAGILLYTGLVELLAHEFIFNKEMITGSNGHVAYAVSCMLLGCGIMAFLGRWA